MGKHIGKNLYLEEDAKNGVVKLTGLAGARIPEIIKEATAYYAENEDIKKIELVGLNGVDLTIDEKTTFESAMDAWQKGTQENAKKAQQKHEEWLRSPEGIAETERKQKEHEEHEAFVFHSVDEALLALTELKPCDLSSDKTSQAEALAFCQDLMTILLKCEDLRFNDTQRKEMSDILKTLGATNTKGANEKFVSGEQSVGVLMGTKGSIGFPLSALDQLIDTSATTFDIGLAKLTEGGMKYSWIGEWLKTQNKKEKTLDDNK